MEGVPRRRAVGIEGSDAVRRDYLVVRGVACRIFDHVELGGDSSEMHAHRCETASKQLVIAFKITFNRIPLELNECFKIIMILRYFLTPLASHVH